MGNSGARYLAAICAVFVVSAAHAQLPPINSDAEAELYTCALTNLRPLMASKESAEDVAIAAMAPCGKERTTLIITLDRSVPRWEFARRTLIDFLISVIVKNRLPTDTGSSPP